MIIRKITEYTQNGVEERFHLVSNEREEGWDMSREEFENMLELGTKAVQLATDVIVSAKEIMSDILDKFRENMGQSEDLAEECPDFIEPPESTETVEKVLKEVGNEPKQAKKEQKEVKNAQKRVVRDFTPYIEMSFKAIPAKEIIRKIEDDFKVSHSTAYTYYYSKVVGMSKKQKEDEKLRSIEAEKKQLERKLQKKINSDPLTEDLASLPDYGSYSDFKDMCSMMDIGRGKYTLQKLKEIYLNTHPNIKW